MKNLPAILISIVGIVALVGIMVLLLPRQQLPEKAAVGQGIAVANPVAEVNADDSNPTDATLEKTYEGTITLLAIDDFNNTNNSRTAVMLDTGKEWIELKNPDLKTIKPGSKVRLTGIMNNGKIDVSDYELLQSRHVPGPEFHLGDYPVLVIMGEYGNLPFDTGFTADFVNRLIFGDMPSAVDYYDEVSYQKTHLTGEFHGIYYLGDSAPEGETCWHRESAMKQALMDAAADDVDYQQYKGFVFVLPVTYGCGLSYSLLGPFESNTPDGVVLHSEVTLNVYGNPDLNYWGFVATHELGHSLGTPHSNYANCGQAYFGDDLFQCQNWEYGNVYSTMGLGYWLHFTANFKNQLAWLDDENMITAESGGLFMLSPLETQGGIKQLLVPWGFASDFPFTNLDGESNGGEFGNYSFEYRQPSGYDLDEYWPLPPEFKKYGVFVTFRSMFLNPPADWMAWAWTTDNLVGTHQPDGSYWPQKDAVLSAGEGYHDNQIGMSLNVLSTDPEGALVEIVRDPSLCRRDFPIIRLVSKFPAGAVVSGIPVTYLFSLRNADSPECLASGYDISVEGLTGWQYILSPTTNVEPGHEMQFSVTTSSPAQSSVGNYSFNVSVKNQNHFRYDTHISSSYIIRLPGGASPFFDKRPMVAR